MHEVEYLNNMSSNYICSTLLCAKILERKHLLLNRLLIAMIYEKKSIQI